MQSNILRVKIVVCMSILVMLISSCIRKNESENQITIKINVIDSKTKQRRINKFDTIVIRKEGTGYLTKTFDKIGEYVTDSSGSVEIKVDSTKGYMFLLSRKKYYGSETFVEAFTKEKLRDGQEVNIEAILIENNK